MLLVKFVDSVNSTDVNAQYRESTCLVHKLNRRSGRTNSDFSIDWILLDLIFTHGRFGHGSNDVTVQKV